MSPNHLNSFDSSYDENTFDDERGSNVNSNLSRILNASDGLSSNVVSLFVFNNNLNGHTESHRGKESIESFPYEIWSFDNELSAQWKPRKKQI